MSTRYLAAGLHPFPVASGATFTPGEPIPASAINVDDPHDQGLLDAGQVIDLQPPADKAKEKSA